MRFLSSFRRKRLTQHELRELFRRSEQGSSWPEVSPEAQEQFDADQQIIDQISGAASSVSPTDAPLQRGALLSRVAEARKARAEERVPMLLRRVPKRTVVIAGAVAILIMAAATVGATGSVGDVTDPVDDVLVAVQLKPHKVSVCHVPSEDPDNSHTISIGKSALEEHLAHGDSEGACADGDGKTNGGDASGKIDVCHVPEDKPDKPHTISVAEGALEEHLAHGDSAGECLRADGPEAADDGAPSTKVDLCHVPQDSPEKPHTISIAEGALEEHLAHGDSAGACATGTP